MLNKKSESLPPGGRFPLTRRRDVGGLWPASWLLGILGWHTCAGLSEHLWTFSATEYTGYREGTQRIIGFTKVQQYIITPSVGRGDPEVDIFEIQPGGEKYNTGSFLESPVGQPYMSDSYKVVPGITYN